MQPQITARHFEAAPRLRTHIDQQIAKLHRFYDGITDIHVILGLNGTPERGKHAEITLSVYRQLLTATDTAATHEEAVNHCVDRIRRQIDRYKAQLKHVDQMHESPRYTFPS